VAQWTRSSKAGLQNVMTWSWNTAIIRPQILLQVTISTGVCSRTGHAF
jgi:hypothetical protein